MMTIGSSVPVVPRIVAVPTLAADPNPVVVEACLAAGPILVVVAAYHPVAVAGSRPA